MSANDVLTVGFPIYDGSTLLDFAGATQIFAKWVGGFNPVWLAPTLDPVTTSEEVQVLPHRCFDDPGPIDILTFDKTKGNKLPAGTFAFLAPEMHHFAFANKETVIQLHGMGPWQINYLNAADDPRNAKKH